MAQLTSLFQPINIGAVELKNRLVMLSMDTNLVVDDTPTQRFDDFYLERAKGGVGLIIMPVTPMPLPATSHVPGVYDDRAIDKLRDLNKAMHRCGARVGAQLIISREWRMPDGHSDLIGPSAIPATPQGPQVRALSHQEIQTLIDSYAEGTRRAREAGFDLVEFHFGMGQLVNRFISSCTNKREDEYGGSLRKRLRLPIEIIAAARKKAGDDYPLICRISADEFMPGGHTLKESVQVAPILVEAGLSGLDVQAGWHESQVPMIQMSVHRGAFVYLAEAIKKTVDVPVVAAYRINDPILADRIVAEGKADLVGMARALLADPELPNKAREGRFEDIRPCIACSRCFEQAVMEGKPLGCAVNPRTGYESEYDVKPARSPKRVFIVGGGPGGMEAATTAAHRGHQVTLFDRGKKLGGQLLVASVPPHKEEIAGLVNYLTVQVIKSGTQTRLGKTITAEQIIAAKPDVVIVATGAIPLIPPIPGVQNANVVTAIDVLKGIESVNERALIIGGGLVGCETALFLAEKGKRVTILEMLPRIGADIGKTSRWVILKQLQNAGVTTITKSRVVEITDAGAKVIRDGALQLVEAETVVLAAGMVCDKRMVAELDGKVEAVYAIGDCVQPNRVGEAIESGFNTARRI